MTLFDGYEVYQEISSVVKVYPDFVRLINYGEPKLVRRYDYDEKRYSIEKKTKTNPDKDDEDYEAISTKRAKDRFIDIALCNPFDMFANFTFAKDRQNVDGKKRQMNYWLNNSRTLHGKWGYLIVPEFHKDNKSLHFHGLFFGYNGNLVDSGIMKKGRVVFNISSFRAGFTEAYKIDNREKVAGYVAKYITKDMPKFKNRQRYWRSNGLKHPLKIVNPKLTDQDKALFSPVFKDKQKQILEFRGQFTDNDLARIAAYGVRREDDLRIYGRD